MKILMDKHLDDSGLMAVAIDALEDRLPCQSRQPVDLAAEASCVVC